MKTKIRDALGTILGIALLSAVPAEAKILVLRHACAFVGENLAAQERGEIFAPAQLLGQ